MPYKSFRQGEEYCVYKIDGDGNQTGGSLGCHDSKSEADEQVAALYASEKSKAPEEVVNLIKSKPSSTNFVVYKSTEGNQLRWLARFSNNIRDDDYPVKEIISAEAHRNFAYMTEKGIVPYPELWVWHEEHWNIGKADWIATDDIGDLTFNLASGEVYPHAKEIALSLGEMDDMGMSHGMNTKYIQRDEADPSIITGFVSSELSVLPKWSAANRYTSYTLDTTEKKEMLRTEKRSALEETNPKIGSLLDLVEEQNAAIASQAKQLGLETKEKGTNEEGVEEEEASAAPEPTDDKSSDAENDDTVENQEESTEEEAVEEKNTAPASDDANAVGRDELVEVLKTLGGRLGTIEDVLVDVANRVGLLETVEAKRKEQPLQTSLVDHISGRDIGSVIGNQKTKVDGRTSLAKSQPEETEDKAQKGLFFEEFLNGGVGR